MQSDLFTRETTLPDGVTHWPGAIAVSEQAVVLDAIAGVMAAAPPFRPRLRNGTPMINRLTNCGPWGWLSDEKGYRYEARHPETELPWPSIPEPVLEAAHWAARQLGVADFEPDACLVNIYTREGKLNLHRDEDEADPRWPIVSLSFGASAIFALGGFKRQDPVQLLTLQSGDAMALHGPSRMRYHGVRRIAGTSPIVHPALPEGGRINLTLRRAT
ncbi:MAG TPA: alkylated DNA repair dioxygenase [Alphaproteobacteria bacterium]|nr:alkylated DNA repair dioxygenase [Alphaproteobacteria bacterium]